MLLYINPSPRFSPETEANLPLRLNIPRAQPERERLRHLIMGSSEGVRSAINALHRLNYAEQGLWSPVLTIPPSGILLTPEQGEVFSYLLRYRSRS